MTHFLFRGKTEDGSWVYGGVTAESHHFENKLQIVCVSDDEDGNPLAEFIDIRPETLGCHFGAIGANDRKLFTGDIVFSKDDRKSYFVIAWIKEWGMFTSILIDEYNRYLEKGIVGIDETYTLYFEAYEYAGNVFDNPHWRLYLEL